MAVALDAAGTQQTATGVTTIAYTGLTVGSGSNRALVASIGWDGDPGTPSVARWDDGGTNQNVSLIQTVQVVSGHSQVSRLYGLVAPTSGAKTLRFTWTGARELAMAAVSWTGADQTGGTTSFPNSSTATGNTATATITITLPTSGAGVSALISGNVAGLTGVSATQLVKYSGSGFIEAGGSYSTSSGTFTGSLSGTDQWAIAATGIAQVGATGDTQEWLGRTAAQAPPFGGHIGY